MILCFLMVKRSADRCNSLWLNLHFNGDFYEGMAMMAMGDSASFICPADSVFFRIFRVKALPEFVKPGSLMRFEIGMEKLPFT
jgi:hypothetical protein